MCVNGRKYFLRVLLVLRVCQIHVWSTMVKISENTNNFKVYFIISKYSAEIAILQNLHAEIEQNLILDAREDIIICILI